MNEGS